MERVDKEGQVVTAKVPPYPHSVAPLLTCIVLHSLSLQSLATMLSQIPLAARGPAQIIVFDVHALQERCVVYCTTITTCVVVA